MNILILSFYFPPDLCAGSFRTKALLDALIEIIPDNTNIDIITTMPNRYHTYSNSALELERHKNVTIHRINLPSHKSGMLDQAKAFIYYARSVYKLTKYNDYDLVYGTSSRLMTASLSAYIANKKNIPLYLDIRDIFVDTIKDVLNPVVGYGVNKVFTLIEKWTINQAHHVNLVSRGFEDYFRSKFKTKKYSFYSNGIDEEFNFTYAEEKKSQEKNVYTILYAGNIGESQGLHRIIPSFAKINANKIQFKIIGDGGRKEELLKALESSKVVNVKVVEPLNREELVNEYKKADILFVHLNDYPAFRKVLPSKLFEYAATGKPILAGVTGFSAQFIKEEIENAIVFEPCNADDASIALKSIKTELSDRSKFMKKYERKLIMKEMARDILKIANTNI